MVAFSIAFHDKFEDKESTLMCLKGFQYSIRIACIFGLSVSVFSLFSIKVKLIVLNLNIKMLLFLTSSRL